MKERKYSELIDKDNIINRIDLKNKFEFVMKSFLKLLDYKKEEVIGILNLKQLLKNINSEEKVEQILNYISNNKEWNGFVKLKRNNNEEFVWVKLNLIPFYFNGIKNGYQIIIEKPRKEDILKENNKEG